MEIKVTGLNMYPIKSCKGCRVDTIKVDSYGVVGDRRFMLTDGTGRFLSQRKHPRLALVTVTWVDDAKRLLVTAPGMPRELRVEPSYEGAAVEASIWEDTVSTIDQGEEPAKWFSEYLGIGTNTVRLVAVPEGFNRPVDMPPTLKDRLPPMKIALVDRGPVSLISQESLMDLNGRLKEACPGHTVPLTRFRMNIEIEGCGHPFEEDEWLVIKIGSVPLLLFRNSMRCKMTGIDQDTGEEDKLGPLEILRQYRAPAGPTKAMFGQLCLPLQVGGAISVGDTVAILDRKK